MSAALQVDTNIVSFLLKKDTRAEHFKPLLRGKTLYPLVALENPYFIG